MTTPDREAGRSSIERAPETAGAPGAPWGMERSKAPRREASRGSSSTRRRTKWLGRPRQALQQARIEQARAWRSARGNSLTRSKASRASSGAPRGGPGQPGARDHRLRDGAGCPAEPRGSNLHPADREDNRRRVPVGQGAAMTTTSGWMPETGSRPRARKQPALNRRRAGAKAPRR